MATTPITIRKDIIQVITFTNFLQGHIFIFDCITIPSSGSELDKLTILKDRFCIIAYFLHIILVPVTNEFLSDFKV